MSRCPPSRRCLRREVPYIHSPTITTGCYRCPKRLYLGRGFLHDMPKGACAAVWLAFHWPSFCDTSNTEARAVPKGPPASPALLTAPPVFSTFFHCSSFRRGGHVSNKQHLVPCLDCSSALSLILSHCSSLLAGRELSVVTASIAIDRGSSTVTLTQKNWPLEERSASEAKIPLPFVRDRGHCENGIDLSRPHTQTDRVHSLGAYLLEHPSHVPYTLVEVELLSSK